MVKLSSILPNPENPRSITEEQLDKLVQSLKEFPQMMNVRPLVIDENRILLGGNMRHKALGILGYDEIPAEWVQDATDWTEEQKKEFIIKDNVSFGEWDWGVLEKDWGIETVSDWGLDAPADWTTPPSEEQKVSEYTRKIEAPSYEPKNEKPSVDDLMSGEKTIELMNAIHKAKLPEDEKKFLLLAANRHNVFNYEKIADYYAHSSKKVQRLMEDSALVIIDFDKAIANGFVQLSEEIKNQYLEDVKKD